jgi:hypothetical protein
MPRDREEILGMLLSSRHFKSALSNADELAASVAELVLMFGHDSYSLGENAKKELDKSSSLRASCMSLQSALRCSLAEEASGAMWKHASARVMCVLALYSDNSEELIASVLGGVVKADNRRLDDVRSSVEDEAVDHLSLCKVIMGLSSSVI